MNEMSREKTWDYTTYVIVARRMAPTIVMAVMITPMSIVGQVP